MNIPDKDGYYWARCKGSLAWEPVELFFDAWYMKRKVALLGDDVEYEIGVYYFPLEEFGAEIVR